MFFAHWIDGHVLNPGVFADHHAFVDLVAGGDEQAAAFLDHDEGVGGGHAVFHAPEHAIAAGFDFSRMWGVIVE